MERPVKCPGLRYARGIKWWVPQNARDDDITYCDFCKRSLPISACRFFSDKLACSCDSFILKQNIKKSLFHISLWSTDYETHFECEGSSEKDDDVDGIYKLPSNTPFILFVTSVDLPENQYFQLDVSCNGKPVCIQSAECLSQAPLYKLSALVQGFTHGVRDFVFAEKGSSSDAVWDLVQDKVVTEVKVKITVFQQESKIDWHNLSDTFMGKYRIHDKHHVALAVDCGIPPYVKFISDSHTTDPANHPIRTFSQEIKYFSQVTKVPIEVNVRLKAIGSPTDVDLQNIPLIAAVTTKKKFELTQRMKQLIESQKRATEELERTHSEAEVQLLELATQLSHF